MLDGIESCDSYAQAHTRARKLLLHLLPAPLSHVTSPSISVERVRLGLSTSTAMPTPSLSK
eukprot:3412911-Pleurochrysis_carterae.AAC.3